MNAPVGFPELQRRLAERLRHTLPEDHSGTIVVCPSTTFPVSELRKIVGIQFYEERLLCLALLLRNPDLELVFPTSVPVMAAIVDYYLSWLPDPDSARSRLHLFSVDNADPQALTDKLLARPDVLAQMRERICEPDAAFILPFNVTPAEVHLAEQLGVPIYGAPPELTHLGSKSGARGLADAAGVAVFEGSGDLCSLQAISAAIGRIRQSRRGIEAVVAKLNNGFSGQGNVILELDQLRDPLEQSPAVFCASEESWDTYAGKVEAEGAIVEELERTPGAVSPSVQLRILPGGRCEVISTHDQILGGPDEQVYLGCRFPARHDYRSRIRDAGLRVARVMARRGVLGSFGIDFVVVPDRGVFLSEINLRLGGTTHPFLMAHYVTRGVYDPERDELLVNSQPRVYKASDNLKSPTYVGLTPEAVINAVHDAGLAYDPGTGVGVTLHLLGALAMHGKFGMVCIARSHEEADRLYDGVVAAVDALGRH